MLSVSYSYSDGQSFEISLADTASAAEQTAAIQTALSTVAAHGGGAVNLSAGTWTVAGTGKAADGCLKIGSNTTLEGAGMGATVLQLADGSSAVTGIIRTDSGKTNPDGTYTTVDNVAIKGLTLDGNSANTSGNVDGFYCGPKPGSAEADTNISLDQVEIMNCSRYGFDPHEQTIGLTITNSAAHHNGVDGFVIDFCSEVILANNVAYDNGRHGFNIVTGSHDVTMTNNDAHNNGGSGIVVQTGDNEIRSWTDTIQISGGTLADNGRAGIEIRQASNIDIGDVTITGNTMDGIRLSGVESVDIHDNTFADNGSGAATVSIRAFLQTFGDSDALNDRWIGSYDVTIEGMLQADVGVPSGGTAWAWAVTAGNDHITGSAGRDTIAADSGDDTVFGGAGDDTIFGNAGDDVLDGGAGNDMIYGGAGNDRLIFSAGIDLLDGGAGYDTIDFSKAIAAVTVDLSASAAKVLINGTVAGHLASIEGLKGSSFNDRLIGNDAANQIDGGGGNDVLDGGAGDDVLFGGRGNDRLSGGFGDDVMTGGTGSDVFVFGGDWGSDTITDFTRKQDKFDMKGVAGLGSFSQLAITQVGSDTLVSFGGDEIRLVDVSASTIVASDFMFS